MAERDYMATGEDFEQVAKIGGIDFTFCAEGELPDEPAEQQEDIVEPRAEIDELLREMAQVAFDGMGDGFAEFAGHNMNRIRELAPFDENIVRLLIMGYRMGISRGSGACMNDLGALYYMGELVEQDYAKAAELYEMAIAHGCSQSVINLGYIHEYGRTGTRDYDKAYRCYALAAALEPSSEATYKLGDMHARGEGVERNMRQAHALWERSLQLAEGPAEEAHPSIRIAQLLIDPECEQYGVEPNPLLALHLFMRAEVGLRIEIANGMSYYKKKLTEAIEGQKTARELLDTEERTLE